MPRSEDDERDSTAEEREPYSEIPKSTRSLLDSLLTPADIFDIWDWWPRNNDGKLLTWDEMAELYTYPE